MRSRALQTSPLAWLLLAVVVMTGTVGRTIRLPRAADVEASRATPSTVVVERTPRSVHRTAVAPAASDRRPTAAERAKQRQAAAMLLLLMLGRDRLAAAPR
ncbi:MAG TPA: hypothetical protein VMS22_04530 [Candidatus Eisenbacteria bacterium]|nr:hypothetical protein [Candidatus Eisenbacteria bacterium]